ncbi:MAG: hypothetical protein ACLGGX_02375 [Bdellovibrionia bacterium]
MFHFWKRTWPAWSLLGILLSGVYFLVSPSKTFETAELSSRSETFETPKSCGPERNYLLQGIRQLPRTYSGTRQDELTAQMPRQCVNFVMHNFVDAKTNKSMVYGTCGRGMGRPQRGSDGDGAFMPCVTEEYVNSVYNSLLDVADCLNVPIKELMPKLYNESGLHVNTLGPDADGGVGQLTRQALQEVFMRFDDIEGRESTLNYYLREMGKSKKVSCQRILAQRNVYSFEPPAGKKLCQVHETDQDCYKPWMVDHRCEFMTGPENPLRNVLVTAIYYRTMFKNVTGIHFREGEDQIWNQGRYVSFRKDMNFTGNMARRNFVQRLENLGVDGADQEIVRQILVGFGFNGGIGTGQILLDNYLKMREARQIRITKDELDFQNISIGSWSLYTNPRSFFNLVSGPDDEAAAKSLEAVQVLSKLQMNPAMIQRRLMNERKFQRGHLFRLEQANDEEQLNFVKSQMIERSENLRRDILNMIFEKSYLLTLPEFMRVGHAWQISFKKGGGAPGYLTFLANKHKQLEKEMGSQVCTAEKYLQF